MRSAESDNARPPKVSEKRVAELEAEIARLREKIDK
jgi:hypothetical protein